MINLRLLTTKLLAIALFIYKLNKQLFYIIVLIYTQAYRRIKGCPVLGIYGGVNNVNGKRYYSGGMSFPPTTNYEGVILVGRDEDKDKDEMKISIKRWSSIDELADFEYLAVKCIYQDILDLTWRDGEMSVNLNDLFLRIERAHQLTKDIDARGFATPEDFTNLHKLKRLQRFFTDDDNFISGKYLRESVHLLFNLMNLHLYELCVKILELHGVENDTLADIENLSRIIYGKLDPSLRVKLQKRGLVIKEQIYAGFDSEYYPETPKTNKLLSVQLAVNTRIILKIPKQDKYELIHMNALSGEEYRWSIKEGFNYDLLTRLVNRCIDEIRVIKYKDYDRSIDLLIAGLKGLNLKVIEKDGALSFLFNRTPIKQLIYYPPEGRCTLTTVLSLIKAEALPVLKLLSTNVKDLLRAIYSNIAFDESEIGPDQ